MKTHEIKIELLDSTNETTIYSYLKFFNNELTKYITLYNVDEILTNGNLGSVMQNFKNYNINIINKPTQPNLVYSIGFLKENNTNIDILIDPYLKWSDNRIKLYSNGIEVATIIVKDDNNILI